MAGATCVVEKAFVASPRRLLVAVLAARPQQFRLVEAQADSVRFTLSGPATNGTRVGEPLAGSITPVVGGGSLLRVVGAGVVTRMRTIAAMQEFVDRVEFRLANSVVGHPEGPVAETGVGT